MSIYNNALTVLQAYPKVDFLVSNFFPLVGEEISLENISEDDDSFEWSLDDSNNSTTNTSDRTTALTPLASDNLLQSLEITNTVGVETLSKYVYPLTSPLQAYYEFTLNSHVVRVNEVLTINLINRFNFVGEHTVTLVITNHIDGTELYQGTVTGASTTFTFAEKGIYDIELQTTTNGDTIYFKQEFAVTVNPALQDRNVALEHNLQPALTAQAYYGIPASLIDGEDYNFTDTVIAPGTTIVLVKDTAFPVDSIYRLRLANLHGTEENPIVITIDESTPFQFGFESWWGIYIENCSNIIIDGRGYQNLKYGIEFYSNPNTDNEAITSIQGGTFSTDVEIHNIECHDTKFAGIMFKTDPEKDNPATWRPTTEGGVGFECRNLKLHNNYIHEVGGEGYYLGYFDGEVKTEVNSQGEEVTYRAHKLIDNKIYRNKFYRCGWDSLQLNNAYGNSEVAYNELIDSGWLGEFGQNTGMSMSLEGKVYNNIINGGSGNGIQYMPLGTLELYNNLIYNLDQGVNVLYLLAGNRNVPEVNPNGTDENSIAIEVYNNNLIATGKGKIHAAQNVIAYNGLRLRNNVEKYIVGFRFTGQSDETLALWEANSSNNINLTVESVLDVKLADIDKGNFNYYVTSIIANNGLLIGSQYDIRGYKNWADTDKFHGCFSSIIKPASTLLKLDSILIKDGEATTDDPTLTILITTRNGTPNKYRISESNDFTGVNWITWIGSTISYDLVDTALGVKNIYVEVGIDDYETPAKTDSIELVEPVVVGNKLQIDFGSSLGGRIPPSGWNNMSDSEIGVTQGSILRFLVNDQGMTTSYDLEVTAAFDSAQENTTAVDEFYDHSVQRDCWKTIAGSPSSVTLLNCLDIKRYTIHVFCSKGYEGTSTNITINGVTQNVNHKDGTQSGRNTGNVDVLLTFTDVAPVANEVVITVEGTANQVGFVNAIVITDNF